jgi:putative nucleotidyltransferase with HDIG domain
MIQFSLNHLATQEKTRREILYKSDFIAPLPELVVRLLELLRQEETEPIDIEELVQNDQVLVAKMLAMVNSPFYGMNRSIQTIREAVMVLGFCGVRSIVLSSGTAKFLQQDYSAYGHDRKGLWLHAVCVAAGSRKLAIRCQMSREEAEHLFIAGLLHDIGKLLLAPHLPKSYAANAEQSIEVYEQQTTGIDHTEAGALVAAKWNLSPNIQEILNSHHNEQGQPGDRNSAVIRLADAVAHELGTGYRPKMAPRVAVSNQDLTTLGLVDESWAAVRDEMVQSMDQATTAWGALGN